MATRFKIVSHADERKADLDLAIMAGLKAATELVRSTAVPLARNATGQLQSGIKTKVVRGASKFFGVVGTNDKHAPHNEFGTGEFAENGMGRKGGWSYQDEKGDWHYTKGMKPQPFLRPGFKRNKENIKRVIAAELKKIGR